MTPVSPYGAAKLCAFHNVQIYRKSYNLFACNGILFNHESPFRGVNFVTNKIVRGAVMINKGITNELLLGNLDASRDWGHAKDYVNAMLKIMELDKPDDFVLATNEFHSVREFVEVSFKLKGFEIEWRGKGLDEIGFDKKTGKELIQISERYFRPSEVEELLGDSNKAKEKLKWEPKIKFKELVEEMVNHDCK